MPVVLSALEALVFFIGGFSQGPLGVIQRLMGESLGFLFPGRCKDRCSSDTGPLDLLSGAQGI